MNILKVKRLHPDAKLPSKAYSSDAGFDLYTVDNILVAPLQQIRVNTGIALEIPVGYVGLIWDRSGLGSKGVHRLAGVIDAGYRDVIQVCLTYLVPATFPKFPILQGDRVAQILIQRVEEFQTEWADELAPSDRGTSGFGSSGA